MRSNDDEAYCLYCCSMSKSGIDGWRANYNRGAPSSYVKLGMCHGSPHPSTREKKLSEHLVGTNPRQIRYPMSLVEAVTKLIFL